MKKIFILFTILVAQLTFGQNLDNAAKNKIKAKFYGAEASYNQSNYKGALEKILEIEDLGNGLILPTAQNLKVKILIGLKEFSKAKKELDKLQNLNLSEDIIKDIASYSDKIDAGITIEKSRLEKERQATLAKLEKEKEEARQKELARLKKEKKEQIFNDKRRLFVQKLLYLIHLNPYEEFGNNAKETLIWQDIKKNEKGESYSKYGLINKYTGEVIVQAKYDEIEAYSDGLYKVGIDINPKEKYSRKKYGYINEVGEVVIPIKFLAASSFSNNIAIAYLNKEQMGLINKKGEFILIDKEIDFSYPSPPTEGMVPFRDDKSGLQGFKNASGEIVSPAKHGFLGNFLNGIANAKTKDESIYYFIDKNGNRIDDNNYASIKILNNYFYTLTKDSIANNYTYGITNGKVTLKSTSTIDYLLVTKIGAEKGIKLLGENLVAIKNNNLFKIYNINTGKLHFSKAFKNVAGNFDGGLVYIHDETGVYYIDATGNKYLYNELNGDSKKYTLIYREFYEGLLAVENKSMLNRITFIDKTGLEVIKTVFNNTKNNAKDYLYFFNGGIAKVYSKATGKYYYIDKSGETL